MPIAKKKVDALGMGRTELKSLFAVVIAIGIRRVDARLSARAIARPPA